jgi:hypothetical protein
MNLNKKIVYTPENVKIYFPIGSEFIHRTNYGGELKLIVKDYRISNINKWINGKFIPDVAISIVAEPHDNFYDVKTCDPLLRDKKIKKLFPSSK